MATERQLRAFRQFVADGYSKQGAAALVGNASQESGVNLVSGYRQNTDHGSQGIFQWRLDRLNGPNGLIAYCDQHQLHSGTLAAQVKFAIHELGTQYEALDERLRKGGDIAALTEEVCWKYERPARQYANVANRVKQAKLVYNAAAAETNAKGGAVVSAGSAAGAILTYLGQGPGIYTLLFTIAAVAIGIVVSAVLGPRKAAPEESPPKPATFVEIAAAVNALEKLLTAPAGTESLTEVLTLLLAGRSKIDQALTGIGDLIRARAKADAELLAQIPATKILDQSPIAAQTERKE